MSIRSFKRAHARRIARERRGLAGAKRRALVAGATIGASAVFAAGAQAATYTVTTAGDDAGTTQCTNGQCDTLRDAVSTSNNDTSADTIVFASSLSGQTITLDPANGPLTITGSGGLSISGPGAASLAVSGNHSTQIFHIAPPSATPPTSVSISGLTLENGSANGRGGAIENDTAALSLSNDVISGSVAGDGDGGGVFSNGPLTVSGSTITGNTATYGSGGGIAEEHNAATITTSQITGNHATKAAIPSSAGGGIYAFAGHLSVSDSTVSGNTSDGDGGGIEFKYSSPEAALRASAQTTVVSTPQSVLQIARTTLSGNQSGSYGGGLSIGGSLDGSVDVIDSTLSGNTASHGAGAALGDGRFGYLSEGSNGSIAFDNSTIASNTASVDGGGVYLQGAAQSPNTAAINSTIVALNTAAGSPQDLFGPTSAGDGGFNAAFSLIQAPPNAPTLSSQSVITGVDPQLGALQDNGGPTQTMLPSNTSPALDQGKAAAGLATDQRGDARTVNLNKSRPPGGDGTDIGAVEVAAPVTPVVQPGPSPPSTVSQSSLSVLIQPATGVNAIKALLHGKVNTNGAAVTWQFQYGRTTSYGKTTSAKQIGAGHGQVPVSFPINHLSPNTVYHFRLVAMNASGKSAVSADATFKTASLHVRPGVVLAGHSVRVFGGAGTCARGDRMTLISNAFSPAHRFGGKPAVYTTVVSGHTYSVITTIPANRAPARYAVTARCDGGNLGVTTFLRVVTPPTPRFTG